MPALSMSIEIRNLQETADFMDRLANRLVEGFGPALVEIGELGSKYFAGKAFDSKGAEFGDPWDPLAPSTRDYKAKHWPGRADLVQTGTMQNSFAYEVTGVNSVKLYNEAPWFVYHQSSAPRHKLPRRVMIGVTASFEQMVKTALEKQTRVLIEEARRA